MALNKYTFIYKAPLTPAGLVCRHSEHHFEKVQYRVVEVLVFENALTKLVLVSNAESLPFYSRRTAGQP